MLLFCGVFAVVCLVYSVKLGYTSLRDALFPAKSALAQSIRSQLPYPEEAPEVEALFDMVDQDIGAHGKWFDRVAVGEQWVFGDMVTAIPRIRAVFGRDEVLRGSGMQRARIVQLYILDDRHQVQWTDLRNPRALQELLEYLSLKVPGALFLPYSEYRRYQKMSKEQWQEVLQGFSVPSERCGG